MPQSIHQFAEKVALVSDASSPVGRAVAMQLALQGCFVVGLFQTANNGSLDELVELGTLANAVNADPSTYPGAAAAAAEVERLYGRLDLLVNCLKFRPESSFEKTTESEFLDVVARNLGSVHFLTQAVFSLMKDRPKPKIVNLASAEDTAASPVFTAAQAGVLALTRAMADQFSERFRVNCVTVQEAKYDAAPEPDALYRRSSGVAPDDVARAVLFLLSSESIGMNGQTLIVS